MSKPNAGAWNAGAHVFPVRVYYEDTDAGGIVYHSIYLNYAERGRTEMVRSLGICQRDLLKEEGIAFAVRRCSVDFARPARLEDDLSVETRIQAVKGASLELEQVIRQNSEESPLFGQVLVSLSVQVACMTTTGKATRFPPDLRRRLERFAGAEAESL